MQPSILEEKVKVIYDKDGREYTEVEVMDTAPNKFKQIMEGYGENENEKKSDLSLDTYIKCLDFKFWGQLRETVIVSKRKISYRHLSLVRRSTCSRRIFALFRDVTIFE